MKAKKNIFIAAGGTGGHIYPAIAIGCEFQKNNFEVTYFTGKRHLDYRLFKDQKTVVNLTSAPLIGRSFYAQLTSIIKNTYSFFESCSYILKKRPDFAVGCGGYVCGPLLLACKVLGVKVFILEQNSVTGLTNKILARISSKIFTNFKNTIGLEPYSEKIKNTGNPLRETFYQTDFNSVSVDKKINLLIFGGSLGAESINNFVKGFTIQNLGFDLNIIHQTGLHFLAPEKTHDRLEYQYFDYLNDIEAHYKWADLIMCRGGATTISELKVVAKPCIVIPLMIHKDKHQLINAKKLKSESNFNVEIIEDLKKIEADNYAEFKSILKRVVESGRVKTQKRVKPPQQLIYQEIIKND